MTSAIGSYGETSGLVRVGDRFWASLLVSTPGTVPLRLSGRSNRFCSSRRAPRSTRPATCAASSSHATSATCRERLVRGHERDVGLSRSSHERQCLHERSVGPRRSTRVATQIGYRLIPNGLMLKIFVPVIASQTLTGANGQVFDWLVGSSAAFNHAGPDSHVRVRVLRGGESDRSPVLLQPRGVHLLGRHQASGDREPRRVLDQRLGRQQARLPLVGDPQDRHERSRVHERHGRNERLGWHRPTWPRNDPASRRPRRTPGRKADTFRRPSGSRCGTCPCASPGPLPRARDMALL